MNCICNKNYESGATIVIEWLQQFEIDLHSTRVQHNNPHYVTSQLLYVIVMCLYFQKLFNPTTIIGLIHGLDVNQTLKHKILDIW